MMLIAIAGSEAVYAAIPQSITCYNQFGFTQQELEDEEASILFFKNLFQGFQANLDQHTGHEDLKQLSAQANTKFIKYKNLVTAETSRSKVHCIATETLALTLGQQLSELIAKKAERFGHNYNEAQKTRRTITKRFCGWKQLYPSAARKKINKQPDLILSKHLTNKSLDVISIRYCAL